MKVRRWAPLRRRCAPGRGTRAAPRSHGHGHTTAFGATGRRGALQGHPRDVRHRFTTEAGGATWLFDARVRPEAPTMSASAATPAPCAATIFE